ncbi:ferredoxin-type protein NapF [Cognatishimia sp. WU-CL00825]|uniref:ferredoxin-type protein NapF n=1 Tax=Cognatishimia sp. WU-CL00825 TaxID=3127658 RepID=UPI0033659BE4
MSDQTLNRRDFFRGAKRHADSVVVRPPGITTAGLSRCTSCKDCATACPEQVIGFGPDKMPFLAFAQGGCSFCGDCATACQHDVFDPDHMTLSADVAIASKCLLQAGTSCQICTDFCDTEALRFDLSVRPFGAIHIDNAACTGCGFCVSACPVDAISVTANRQKVAA